MALQLAWALAHGVPMDSVHEVSSEDGGVVDIPIRFAQWFQQSAVPEGRFRAQHYMSGGRRVGAWQILTPLCEASRMGAVQFRCNDLVMGTFNPDAESEKLAPMIDSYAQKILRDVVVAVFKLFFEGLLILRVQALANAVEKAIT